MQTSENSEKESKSTESQKNLDNGLNTVLKDLLN